MGKGQTRWIPETAIEYAERIEREAKEAARLEELARESDPSKSENVSNGEGEGPSQDR